MKARVLRGLAVLFLFTIFLAACAKMEDLNPFDGPQVIVPPCPTVKILQDANKVTVFQKGPGRDITDITYEAKFVGLEGECQYVGENGEFNEVIVTVRVEFDLTRGPASKTRLAILKYFVAIPAFFPASEGKQLFLRKIEFPAGRNNISLLDNFVEVRIPLSKEHKGSEFQIYLGFDLTQDQLKRNRRLKNDNGIGE